MSNPKNIQPNTLVHIIRGGKNNPFGVDTYVYCTKAVHMDGGDCGGKTVREFGKEFSSEYCTTVGVANINKMHDNELQTIREKRENLIVVLGDASATNV